MKIWEWIESSLSSNASFTEEKIVGKIIGGLFALVLLFVFLVALILMT